MGHQQGVQENMVTGPVLLFDGVCHLCNHTVHFVIKRDKAGKLRFASLQSDYGQARLREAGLPMEGFKTLALLEDGVLHTHSTGALRLVRHLDAPWKWLYALIIIPVPIRDFFYNTISRNRYRWFGKSETCMMPTADIRARFLG